MSQRQLTSMAAFRLRSVQKTLERLMAPCPVIHTAGHILVSPHPSPPPQLSALRGLLRPGRR